jgi:hypothetical protein
MIMANNIYDLKPMDPVQVRISDKIRDAQFIGFFRDGLECQVGTWKEYTKPDGSKGRRPINTIVLVSDLITEGNQ